jgi:anaerobic selenocysteine-containing dehydrogenase
LKEERSVRLSVGRPYLPFAVGAPTPSGKVEFVSESLARAGLPSLPTYVPLVEGPENEAVARRYPLQCIVPPNRFFLNSSFSQSDKLRRRQQGASVFLHPEDARPRGIADGDAVMVRSARGEARFTAGADRRHARGWRWWRDLVEQAPGGRARGQRPHRRPDRGHGRRLRATLNLVQVERLR